MTALNFTVKQATPAMIRVQVTGPATMARNTNATRTLVLQLAAFTMGMTLKGMYDAGYARDLQTGWDMQDGPLTGTTKTVTYVARPETAREVTARLRDRGGFVQNSDGSMGFQLPAPRRAPRTATIRQQGDSAAERMDRARLK